MIKLTEIIEKLKDILSNELVNKKILDKDIALALNITYDNFRKQKSRGTTPYYEIMAFLAKRNISINWFFFNQLPESLIDSTSNYIILKYQRTINASAGGGAINYELDPSSIVIDKQFLDHINSSYKYTEVIKVLGESMEPDINDNSLVLIDKSIKDIKSTGIYLINTPEGLFLKQLKLTKDHAELISINKDVLPIKISLLDIIIVGKATGVLIKL